MTDRRTLLATAVAGAAVAGVAGAVVSRRRSAPPSTRLGDADVLLRRPDLEPRVRTVVAEDGARLHVREYGDPDADPIVLSHGWTCSADYWTPQINDLAGTYRVVVYDQRGHGASDVGTRPLGPDVLGDDLAAVLDATVSTDRPAVLAGHSMGGMSVMAWAGEYPEQVRRYVKAILLANTATDSLVRETTVIPLPPGVAQVPARVASSVMGSVLPIPSSPLSARALKYVTMGSASTRAQVAFCERIVRDCAPRTRGMWGSALSTLDIRDALHNIDVPTSVIVGTVDRLTPPVHARSLAEQLSRAGVLNGDTSGRLIELPGVGHMSSVEAIAEFDAELVRLAELPA
ncbi:alpha/beta hydrolase [Rhodococcus sp. Leaf7]|uniref:alpha/beta fold hydrolase n=1 Tax=unclassified Rhodococcus (in: high G+C Gram-positive bacteria) TaxID=192944 RepID=UPI0006F63288|nr:MULTISPECIES: alpha/beta hydrolase [unclassified Rhodococcus (in: high G+C Gram-positive bacteria)]KQU04217.1 alpha/beta hydrolase [Rhodococcus sp. Leaf7]KQU40402.1 alpha/beta hydrolase [Rhodococcus sp. Leaf247]